MTDSDARSKARLEALRHWCGPEGLGESVSRDDVAWLLGEYDRLTQRVSDMGVINGELLQQQQSPPIMSGGKDPWDNHVVGPILFSDTPEQQARTELLQLTTAAMRGGMHGHAAAHSAVAAMNALDEVEDEQAEGEPEPDDG